MTTRAFARLEPRESYSSRPVARRDPTLRACREPRACGCEARRRDHAGVLRAGPGFLRRLRSRSSARCARWAAVFGNLARMKARPEAVFLEAFNEAAAALARAHCKLVELQACNSGGPEVSVGDPFGFKTRLARLLSSPDHPVEVRGHSQFITTDIANGAVFIGYDREDARRDNSQYSTDTLPVP